MLAADSAFLGGNLLAWLVLAFGGALVAGNVAALLRPPPRVGKDQGTLEKAPVGRSMAMVAIGFVAALWALLSLLA